MRKKLSTYQDLLDETQKLEALFEAQKALVKFEIDVIRKDFKPAFNALEFLKNLSVRNKKNPIVHAGVSMLIDFISEKTEGEDAGFLRSIAAPFFLKNYASNIVTGPADFLMEQLVSLFSSKDESDEEMESVVESTPVPATE